MVESLTFLMGKFPAVLPVELRYCRNHMWCRPGDGGLRFGFSAYAVRLMQDAYFLDWQANGGDSLRPQHHIRAIHTSPSTSHRFTPNDDAPVCYTVAIPH